MKMKIMKCKLLITFPATKNKSLNLKKLSNFDRPIKINRLKKKALLINLNMIKLKMKIVYGIQRNWKKKD